MADKVRFLIPTREVLSDATISASSAVSGLPVINVLNNHIRRVWRSTNNKSQYLRMVASGAATGFNMVFVGNHNFTKNALVLWQAHTTSNFTSPALNVTLSVATDAYGAVIPKLTHFWANVTYYKHFRLKIQDTGNATVNLQVGVIQAGRYIEPPRNLRDGFTLRTVDPSSTRQTAGRMGYANVRRRYDELTYEVQDLDGGAHDIFYGIYNDVGINVPLVVALDPESRPHHHTYYCQFVEPLERRQRLMQRYDLSTVTFQEKN